MFALWGNKGHLNIDKDRLIKIYKKIIELQTELYELMEKIVGELEEEREITGLLIKYNDLVYRLNTRYWLSIRYGFRVLK